MNALELLKQLKPLPKVHYSWAVNPAMFDNPILPEYARITKALSVQGETVTQPQFLKVVEICKATNASIGINYSPWHRFFDADLPATDTGDTYYEEWQNFQSALEKLESYLPDMDIDVTCIMLDCERFSAIKHDAEAVRKKLDLIHMLAAAIFPKARIEWFGRGVDRPENIYFREPPYFPKTAILSSLSCSLYEVPNIEAMRQLFRKTCEMADKYGVKPVTPWVTLACGNKPHTTKIIEWTANWDYDIEYSWQLGRELNHPDFADRANFNTPYKRAEIIILHPEPFAARVPAFAKHFIAYCRGAAGIAELGDLK